MAEHSSTTDLSLPPVLGWSPAGRALVFLLAATSIWCLLAEFYGLCSMRTFTIAILLPASAILVVMALLDRSRGDGRLWRGVLIGAIAGLTAAVAYDVFRLPFVFAREWHLAGIVPPMNLFKVFPRFGAMILAEPIEQAHYSAAAQWIGWAYHFSNGLTFGVMYMALIGDGRRRSWGWAVLMAVGLELGMLFTPYPRFFGIQLTTTFVIVTLAAHSIFGVMMGVLARALSQRRSAAH
jgi:hypothetical protein